MTPQETAAERLARVVNSPLSDLIDADEHFVRLQLFADIGQVRLEKLLRILLSWSVLPALRAAVEEIEGAAWSILQDRPHAGELGKNKWMGGEIKGLLDAVEILGRHLGQWLDETNNPNTED